jgi:glucose-6-phosphate 1-dehydrogenase
MQIPDPQLLVIFGASGDLTMRKLIPALFDLEKQKLLPDDFAVLGVGRTPLTDDSFRSHMEGALKTYADLKPDDINRKNRFIKRLYYISINTSNPDDYHLLKERLTVLENEYHTGGNIIFYFAIPPALYIPVARSLESEGLNKSHNKGWRRIVIEKPFGYDLDSSYELNVKLLQIFSEEQIYRIDHYLGKETVQNIIVTRFSNAIFEPLWNRNFIHHIEITAAEDIGIENRGGYYENSGALRDMFQNHLLQLVALVAMEPPVWADSKSIRNEILKVFESLRPLNAEELRNSVVRGQYTESTIRGIRVPGYRQENGIHRESRTETFVAVKFFIDNWRWNGVPFYVRTGKRLPTRATEIVIHFQSAPHHIFCRIPGLLENHNQLIIRIQPDEGLLIKFGMKIPGAGYKVHNVNMDFLYSSLGNIYLPNAYERLLLDCMLGDPTLYTRGDAVECAWKFADPILKHWELNPDLVLYGYPAGTWGPKEADSLFEATGYSWRSPCKNLSNDGLYCEL